MRKFATFISIGLLCLFITGCVTDDDPQQDAVGDDFAKDDYKEIVPASNDLAFRLFSEVREADTENSFISPAGLFMALSMVYNSAGGVTKSEMAQTLALDEMDAGKLSRANASLLASLHQKSDDVQLDIANSIWMNDRFHFKEEFMQESKDYFQAATEEINPEDKAAAAEINNWVKKSTNNRINNMVESPLNKDLVALLINAIYFNGKWTYPFDEKETEDRAFHLADGDNKDVPFMKLTKRLAYLENDDFQAVSLPYGEEAEMSMKIFLPKKKTSLQEWEQTLTAQNWDVWNSEFQTKEGTIMLPKFQMEYEKVMDEALKQMGMTSAFDRDADFSKLIEENNPVWISEVKQKTFIDVDEKGTEAAGATSVGMETTSAPVEEEKPFKMDVNRPFFFAIVDEGTGVILFMGSVYTP